MIVSGAATVSIAGNVTGGTAVAAGITMSIGTVNINGNVTGANGPGIINGGAGTLTVTGICQSSTTAPAIAAGSINQITRLSGPFLLGASGKINPVQAQSWRWAPTQIPTYYEVAASNGTTKRSLFTSDNIPTSNYPTTANVRSGTVYGPNNENTGTLAVPATASVALGVPVGNGIGEAILTAAAVQSALTAQGLTTARAGYLDNIATAAPSAADVASAVWAFVTRTLTSGGGGGGSAPTAAEVAAAVWGNATRTLTSTIPTAADVASAVWDFVTRTLTSGSAPPAARVAPAVRTELPAVGALPTATAIRAEMDAYSTKLANLDATVSSRLATTSYSAAPTTAAIRTELTPELDRIANCSTVDTTATAIQDAVSS
jgi:hypothetical protein